MKDHLVIGSRGSKLALMQAESVKARLTLLNPALDINIEIIRTTGDINPGPLSIIGGKGVFTKELEESLLSGRCNLAVHSLKDLPTILPDGLALSAICEREDPRDALVFDGDVGPIDASIANLPIHSVIGTSSQRRLAQLKYLRPDVVIRDLRGNVDTRLRKLDEGQYNALILASAGLLRLGLANRISASIPIEQMLPAVGQGAIGIETRADDEFTKGIVTVLEHPPSRIACTAERSLLRALGGGCQLPIAAYAVVYYQQLRLDGLVADLQGKRIVKYQISGAITEAETLGAHLAEQLLERGADKLLAEL